MLSSLAASITSELRRILGGSVIVELKGETLEVKYPINGKCMFELRINLRNSISAPCERYFNVIRAIKNIDKHIDRSKSELYEILKQIGNADIVAYIRHKIYGGRAGFSLVYKSGGLYKVKYISGSRRWIKLNVEISEETWKSILNIVSELKELYAKRNELLRSLTYITDPLRELFETFNALRRALIHIYDYVKKPKVDVKERLLSEEDPFYGQLLELEVNLRRESKIKLEEPYASEL